MFQIHVINPEVSFYPGNIRKEDVRLGRTLPSLLTMQSTSLLCDPKWMAWRNPETDDCIMHVAAEYSPVMLARLLKTGGGKALMDHTNHQNRTPLWTAVYANQTESVRLLMVAGAHAKCLGVSCPLKYAVSTKRFEVGIALLSGRPTLEGRCAFLNSHAKEGFLSYSERNAMNDCMKAINLRCARAYQAIGTALFVLQKKLGKDQKDVYHFLVKPLLRHTWEHRRYEPVWDIPMEQKSEAIIENDNNTIVK